MAEHYRVRIRRGDSEIEVESNEKAYVDSKLTEHLATAFGDLPKQPSDKKAESTSLQKHLSLQEFVKGVRPKGAHLGGTKTVLAIAYFKEKYDKMAEMRTKDIKEGFRTVKFKHSNPSQAIASARTAGYLMNGKSKKCFTVTKTGEQWIEKQLKPDEDKS